MREIFITAGTKYTDIDALACVVAYTELLTIEGKNAHALIPYPLNQSATQEIKNWGLDYSSNIPKQPANYVIMDVSYPDFIPEFTKNGDIIELFDHHTGYEGYWSEKLGRAAHIEQIGACATLVWEQFKIRQHENKISKTSARLIYAGIVSNTLNFKAQLVSNRDIEAAKEALSYADLSKNWIKKYFEDQEREIYSNPKLAVREDTKVQRFENINKELVFAQLELWDSKEFMKRYQDEIVEALTSYGNKDWIFTSPSINEGHNYIFTKSSYIKKLLGSVLNIEFKGDLAVSADLWLRKEIFREIQRI